MLVNCSVGVLDHWKNKKIIEKNNIRGGIQREMGLMEKRGGGKKRCILGKTERGQKYFYL